MAKKEKSEKSLIKIDIIRNISLREEYTQHSTCISIN